MHALFYSYENPAHRSLIQSLIKGLKRHGDRCTVRSILEFDPEEAQNADVVFAYNIVTGPIIVEECLAREVSVIYYDKGYFNRGWDTANPEVYYRFSVNGFHPLNYFQAVPKPPDRWSKLGLELEPRRAQGKNIVFAGCSAKFASLNGFDLDAYAKDIVRQIKSLTDRPIIYRPKKALDPPPPIPGTIYSHKKCRIGEDLADAHALVTFSSNAAVDAILSGVPAFVLGPGIAKPISNTDLSRINDPWFPSEKERLQWACDLAYCQWRVEEMEDGSLWQSLKEVLSRGT